MTKPIAVVAMIVLPAVIGARSAPMLLSAQGVSSFPPAMQAVISVPETRVALQHVRVVDGTGKAPIEDQTILIDNGKIVAVGPAASTPARRSDQR